MMASTGVTYDTKEIRRMARKFQRCAAELDDGATNNLKKATGEIGGTIEGAAATAMYARIKDMSADVSKLRSQLMMMYRGLNRMADVLEEKDAQIAQMIGS